MPIQSDDPLGGSLIVGSKEDPFLPHLCAAIHMADEIEMAVAFVMSTGLRLLMPDLLDASQRNETVTPAATGALRRVRILTSDYLDVTDPDALRQLMLLQEQGAEVRVYEAAQRSFHMKAYIFAGKKACGEEWGRAFIGSSNISREALQLGLEWNYRINFPGDRGFLEARRQFQKLFDDPLAKPLSYAWIDEYEKRRVKPTKAIAPGTLEVEPAPTPNPVQVSALAALQETRELGYSRGLVVLATGLGKTWLAAFDAQQAVAKRLLFVAHREEILVQAAETFARIRPRASIGFYKGQQRDSQVDILFASIQTIGKSAHLSTFHEKHFDYIVVDEFHHASAPSYQKLLAHFLPKFLLGLTATPNRSDRADILSLCDDNLVFERDLFAGVNQSLLVPFHYYGIFDEEVDYKAIPWRNGKFDPDELANRLATLARANHAYRTWQIHKQTRTLAFCISKRHADFMAEYFRNRGIHAAAVYSDSILSRGEALEQLRSGKIEILFSVDLFNEGMDLPGIDSIMMLRPTESKILFLQQLGRGLRMAPGKEKLIVMDFVANHHSFLHKPQALMNMAMTHGELAKFAETAMANALTLPPGCFINYDLRFIEFLRSLNTTSTEDEYRALRDTLNRRPTITEFLFSGASVQNVRKKFGSWFEFVSHMGDLKEQESDVASTYREFLSEVETTSRQKSYKLVLLDALRELNGWQAPTQLETLAQKSWEILQRRRSLLVDLPEEYRTTQQLPGGWTSYWRKNPVQAWIGGNSKKGASAFFSIEAGKFKANFTLKQDHHDVFLDLAQELISFRLAEYMQSKIQPTENRPSSVTPLRQTTFSYFSDLKIACGNFRTGDITQEEHRSLGGSYSKFDPIRHFIARASGNSMDGGDSPIRDKDLLLLEIVGPEDIGSIPDDVIAIERKSTSNENQYLLRKVVRNANGSIVLRANNPLYEDMLVTPKLASEFRTFARLKKVLHPLEIEVGHRFLREDIPAFFGTEFNPGNWNSGHVILSQQKAQVLFVTLNKQGRAADHRYLDHWLDERHFHWQSQDKTTPTSSKGKSIIHHARSEVAIHLFVREHKLEANKAAPFTYQGKVKYISHTGSSPMSVTFELED